MCVLSGGASCVASGHLTRREHITKKDPVMAPTYLVKSVGRNESLETSPVWKEKKQKKTVGAEFETNLVIFSKTTKF